MTDLAPDWHRLDTADIQLPFGRTWHGYAQFDPVHDGHAFITGPAASGKSVIAHNLAVAAGLQDHRVVNLTDSTFVTPRPAGPSLRETIEALDRRLASDTFSHRIIVLADADTVLTGRRAADHADHLQTIIEYGGRVGVHLALFASDQNLSYAADLDAVDDLIPLLGQGFVALLGTPAEGARLRTFGREGLSVIAPGYPYSGLLRARGNEVEQFRAWRIGDTDFARTALKHVAA